MNTLEPLEIKISNGRMKHFKKNKNMFIKYLVFSTKPCKTSCEKKICERNWTQRKKCKIKPFGHALFTNCKCKWIFTIKSVRLSKKFCCFTSSFLKGSLEVKELKMDELDIFGLFLVGCFSKLVLTIEFIFLRKIKIIGMVCINMFLQTSYPTCHIIRC